MDPSPTPKFDNPKMHMSPALQLFGAGREKRIYAVPPHTGVSLDFEDHPFEIQSFDQPCALCGAKGVYLDEVVLDDRGGRMFVCSDTDHCEERPRRCRGGQPMSADTPLLKVSSVSKFYGSRIGCEDVSFDLWPGEVLASSASRVRARRRCSTACRRASCRPRAGGPTGCATASGATSTA
jgi:hypothetical protein